nr:uncharacterized protein CTRU02_04805 [Colletotrichum truncatum]KAF6795242.1 hypothetical protein CTRU02_04805 [Colletotrichum truncatum]
MVQFSHGIRAPARVMPRPRRLQDEEAWDDKRPTDIVRLGVVATNNNNNRRTLAIARHCPLPARLLLLAQPAPFQAPIPNFQKSNSHLNPARRMMH